MADAIVILLLENLSQVLVKEALSLVETNQELSSLEGQLKCMLSLLEEYDVSDELLNRIRDVSYDSEDVIEDCIFSTYEARNKENWQKFLPKFGKQTTKRDIGKRMKDVIKRTDQICVNLKEKEMEVGAEIGAEAVVEVAATEDVSTEHSTRAPIVEEVEVVGFTNDVRTLVKRLIGGDLKLSVISIVGMGGIGKTTLAKKVYNDFFVKDTFSHRVWVHVSPENTSQEIILGILKCLTKVTEKVKEMSTEDLGNALQSQLKEKKYLIVMDDVWKPQVWEDLKPFFPNNNTGSRIMFTTRMVEVAAHAAESDPKNPPHYPRLLDAEESWKLFHKKALPGETCPPQWEKLGKRIAEKCGGLPLAITALGRLLSVKQGTFDEWSRVDNQVSTFLSESQAQCREILALSYKDLPYHLKPCFFYMSVFPEDHQIPAKQLIHLWVAEGFIKANHVEIMEDTAEKHLEILVAQSLVQVVERKFNGGVKTCSIHRLVRDICISESQPENFVQVNELTNSPPRRLAGNDSTIAYINNPNKVKQLRTLLCFSHKADKLRGFEQLLKTMRYLRVLKVSNSGVVTKEVENLLLLRYFSLDDNSFLQVLSSICNLPNLQVFDARSQSLSFVPVGFWNLKKLRHAYFQGPIFLPQPPESSSTNDDDCPLLKDLQTLSTISPKSCTPEVFHNMPNLLKLGVKGDLNASPVENLEILKSLRKLKLVREFPPLVSLPPESPPNMPPPLISLPLKLPPNLTDLTLCNTQFKDDPMPLLGDLENLQTLKLFNNVYPSSKLICLAGGFPQLKHLKLVSLERVRQVLMMKRAMPNIEHIVIDTCLCLEWLTGVHFLTKLQVLDLKKPTTMLRRRMQELNKEKQLFELQEN